MSCTYSLQAPDHLVQKVCFYLSQQGSRQAIYTDSVALSGSLAGPRDSVQGLAATYQCRKLAAPVLLCPGVTAHDLQHLELELCSRGKISIIGRAHPPRETRPRLTVAELLLGPLALASLPSVMKPAVGGLPGSPIGRSATFRQST